MKTGYILSLDQKCNGSEVLVFDRDGQLCSDAFADSLYHTSADGSLELDPEEVCSTAMRAIKAALEVAGIPPGEVRAIGITNESDAMVLWERISGEPIGRAITHLGERGMFFGDDLQSRRIQKMIDEASGLSSELCRFAGFKLCWMLSRQSGLRERAGRREIACGTLDSWLIYRLTGGSEHITDHSNALRTRLFDTRMQGWNQQLLEMLDIPVCMLPNVRSLSEGFGDTDRDAFFGVQGIPLAGIGEHQKALLFG